jgi:8-oxo-dGTP pyrophosphatase MutT (NUDIX family)
MTSAQGPRLQYAALPWRRAGSLEILLVSSRETKRWVIPKGWPIPGLSPHDAAAREAFEEAGVKGRTEAIALGHYHYVKRRRRGTDQLCRVEVFALNVESQAADWPEKDERTRRWFLATAAADAVEEIELKALIRGFMPGPAVKVI